jgi:hypothetical protein
MSGRVLVALAIGLLAAGCGNSQLGRAIPACPADPGAITANSGAIILQMQAVDTAEYVSCLNDLKAGWSYEDLIPEHGKVRFWLDSDRLGSRFLEVTLTPSCELGSATPVGGNLDDTVAEFRDVELVGSIATMVIVPVTGHEIAYARMIEAELEARKINDRTVIVVYDTGDGPLADKVATAARNDRPLIVVDEQDAQARTATLRMPAESQSMRGLDFDELFDRLDRLLPKPSLTGSWFKVFDGGCITYEFDASGTGVDRLAGDVEEALGLFPAGEFRRFLQDEGILG